MNQIEAAVLYIGLTVLLMMLLKMNVGRVRGGEKVAFGDGGSERMLRAIRVQGNAVEDVPVTLIGLLGLAWVAAPVWLIHVLGAGLLTARVLHAVGLSGSSGTTFGRLAGTLGTVIIMLTTAIACIYFAVT